LLYSICIELRLRSSEEVDRHEIDLVVMGATVLGLALVTLVKRTRIFVIEAQYRHATYHRWGTASSFPRSWSSSP
jgi:hypothetical protein